MNPQHLTVFDGFLSLMGAIGIWPMVYRLNRVENRNPFEMVLGWILIVLFSFWTVRFFFQAFSWDILGGPVYALAIALCFCFCLFFEVILRRHFPFWFKIYMTLGCFIFLLIALGGNLSGRRDNLVPFGIYVLSLEAIVIAFTVFRKRTDYSRSENVTIDTSVVFLLFLAPFFLSDVTSYQIHLPKLGVCGGLIFAYVSIYNQALLFGRGFLVKKLLKSVMTAAALTLACYFLILNDDVMILGRIFVLFFCLHLIFRIYFAIYYLNGEDEMHHFVDHVNQASKKSIPKLLVQMRDYYSQFEATLLKSSDVSERNTRDIKEFFEASQIVTVSQYEVSEWLNNKDLRWNPAQLEAIEKIRDVLETYEKSHLCKLGFKKAYFVLFNCPFISYQKIIESQTDLLSQVVAMIEEKEVLE